METDHFRQVGSLCTEGGPGTAVPRETTFVDDSSESFCDEGSRQKSLASRRGFNTSKKGCNRSRETSSFSRFLLPSFSCTEEERENETGNRPLLSESALNCATFQNGDQQIYQGFNSHRYVDNFSGFNRRLLPHPNFAQFSQVPEVCMGRPGIRLQGNAFWPLYGSPSFHQNFPGSGFPFAQPVNSYPFLSGRFPFEGHVADCFARSHPFSDRITSQVGFPYFLEKVGFNPQSRLHFPGGTFSHRPGFCLPSRRQDCDSPQFNQQVFPGFISHSSSVFTTSGFSNFPDGRYSFRTPSHSSNSVVSERILASCVSGVGSSHSCSTQTFAPSSVVVTEVESPKRSTSGPPRTQHDSVHRCFPFRMGRLPRREDSVRSVGTSSTGRTYQCSRDEGSSSLFTSLSGNYSGTDSYDSIGQYHCSGLSSESRGNSVVFSLPTQQRNSLVLRQSQDITVSETCRRRSEPFSGCLISVPCSSEYGMGTASVSFSDHYSEMGSPPDRSVCHQSELQTGNLRFPNSRSEGISSGCIEHLLERDVQLHLSSLSPTEQNFAQNKEGWLQDHSYCSGMAKTVLVSGDSPVVVCKTSSPSSERGPTFSVQGKKTVSRVGKTASSRLVAVRKSIRQRGFSESATKRISGAVRPSTGAIYDSKWSIFCSWCLQREIDPLRASAQQVADFLVFLFEEKGYSPSTIKGYKSAITRTILLSGGPDLANNEFLSLLIKNFCIERPRQRRLVPAWDLGLVLKALQLSPFEPLDMISFKHLSYKCCFLLALATGRRRSELHALSISESCMRFSADKSSVTLLTDPSFVAKNQLPEKGSGTMVVPALPTSGSVNLCPVRTLEIYLRKSAEFRSKGSHRLFVPIKKGKTDISAKTVSTWICNTVMLAYKSSGLAVSKDQVKAHEIRAISSSWSVFNSASLSEILSAGFWRSDNTFYYHYLRSMPQHSDNLYALGPLVSAQKVIFPPAGS